MPQFITFVVVVFVIYLIARKYTHKEAKEYLEENAEPKEAQNLESVDPVTECIVTFEYKDKKDQFMINSFPNIVIASEKYKLINDTITLKLPTNFELHFGVPYMKGEAFKFNETYRFSAGRKYKIIIKPKAFIFQKPKVTIEELGNI